MKHPKVLRRGFIGINIRPGQVPGGFSHGGSINASRDKTDDTRRINRVAVHAAANAALERRGLGNAPSAFEATQRLPEKVSAEREPIAGAKPATPRLAVSRDTAVSALPIKS